MKEQKIAMDAFGLSRKGDKLHVIVGIMDSEGISQRAWCGGSLDDNNIAWDVRTAAEQIKEGHVVICKRCANGNPKLMFLLQEEQA